MEKIDNRKLGPQSQYELRKRVVQLKSKACTGREISDITGLTPSNISRIWKAYQREGDNGIGLKRRGRSQGQMRLLTPQQEGELKDVMIGERPEQMGLSFALWSRSALQSVVRIRFGIDLPLRTLSDYLKRWGFTPPKSLKRRPGQSSAAVKCWFDKTWPDIVKRAKVEGAEIQWGGGTDIDAMDGSMRGVASCGKAPEVGQGHGRDRMRMHMISSISNQGKMRFMPYYGEMTSGVCIRFLNRLMKDRPRKIFLIVDHLKVHDRKMVTQWQMKPKNQARLALFFLPSSLLQVTSDENLGELHGKANGV